MEGTFLSQIFLEQTQPASPGRELPVAGGVKAQVDEGEIGKGGGMETPGGEGLGPFTF